jgi:galactose mutarotase-like enzyme
MAEPTILLSSGQLSARVALHGAELVQLQDAEGRDLLWDGNPAFWTGRAPLLFPIVGRVAGDHICVDSTFYPLATHGFAENPVLYLANSRRLIANYVLRPTRRPVRNSPSILSSR